MLLPSVIDKVIIKGLKKGEFPNKWVISLLPSSPGSWLSGTICSGWDLSPRKTSRGRIFKAPDLNRTGLMQDNLTVIAITRLMGRPELAQLFLDAGCFTDLFVAVIRVHLDPVLQSKIS